MYPYDIVFNLNDSESFIVELEDSIESSPCFCQVPIVFFINNQGYVLSSWGLPEDLLYLKKSLMKALKNELQLHESLTQDIGYLYNIKCKHDAEQYALDDGSDEDNWQPSPYLIYEQKEDDVFCSWVGDAYRVWGYNNLLTWIYNDRAGNIIFEVTPEYPYFYSEDESDIKVSYDDWINTYQPFLMRIIDSQVAHEWIKQIDAVITRLDIRCAKLENDNNGNNQKVVYEDCPRNK